MTDNVKIHLLPGGVLPKRQTSGAIGFDVYTRAVVSNSEMDPDNPKLRKTLFDFTHKPDNQSVANHVHKVDGELVYTMEPHESVLVGIGFITEMQYPMFYWVAPRSGLATKYNITVTNAPGTVDPDYRGEAGVLIYNRNDAPFDIVKNMRIAQIIFQRALIPSLIECGHIELNKTDRGSGGFGSTGLTD